MDKQELGARTNICVVCLPLCGQLKGFPSDSNVHNLYSQMMKPSSLNNDYDIIVKHESGKTIIGLGPMKVKSFFFQFAVRWRNCSEALCSRYYTTYNTFVFS